MHPDFATFDMRGRRLRYLCRGRGTPAVIIEQGAGISIEESFAGPVAVGWRRVFEQICRTQQTLMHDRAGLGWSYEPSKPRSCSQMVKELRALLRYAEVEPPYVLVGHSIGGFNVRLFAAQYPQEAAGVVLVDSSHPDQWTRFARLIPRATSGEPAALQRFRNKQDPNLTPERIDYVTSADEIRTCGSLGDIPLIVLSRSPSAMRPPGLPEDLAGKFDLVWTQLQQELLKLSTRSTQVVATHAGHNIQLDEPQLVIATILKMLRATASPRPAVH